MDNIFLSIFVYILLLFFGLLASFYKYKSNYLFKEASDTYRKLLIVESDYSKQSSIVNQLYLDISELKSTIETQKEHIQALRRAERRHKYLIKKLNPKNGKKASLQDTKSN